MFTSELQFGFKAKHSTTMCSMILKETLAYYSADGGTAFCTFLDARKAFDRVDYCKLFRVLLCREIPHTYVQLLLNLYTNSVAKINWNGVCSDSFRVVNGVKQGGILSPVLFCIYLDGLLVALNDSKVGCHIGRIYVGALAYADDVTLLAPTPRAMRLQLLICEQYSERFRIKFNAAKSACMVVGRKARLCYTGLQFAINGAVIAFVKEFTHLGHVISCTLDDRDDIVKKRNSFCGKINNVLCYFASCDPFVKIKLLRQYCYDLYGSQLWDLAHRSIDDVCIVWRKGLRRIWSLPYCTHSNLLPRICGLLPLYTEILCRTAFFIMKSLMSFNSTVAFVARNGVYGRKMMSPIGCNAFVCCSYFE